MGEDLRRRVSRSRPAARLPARDARRTAVARHKKSRLRRDAGGTQAADRRGFDSTRSTGASRRSRRI